MRNKNITRTDNERTTLSVSPTSIELSMGKDVDNNKVEPFLSVLDQIITNVASKQYYGHFQFTKNKMKVTLSANKEKPNDFDITYGYELPNEKPNGIIRQGTSTDSKGA